MMKKIKLLILVVFCTTNFLFGQKISNIDFDLIKSQVKDSTSSFYYPVLIQRFLQFDTTLTEQEFCYIYYGNVFADYYDPYGTGENEEKFLEIYEQEKFLEAIPFGEKTLIENPVNLKILLKMLTCYYSLADSTTTKKYANLYFGLLDEIFKSGDGKSIETAYVVNKVNDEYQMLFVLNLQCNGQVLLMEYPGPTDKLIIKTKGQKRVKGRKKISKIYFNVAKPFEHMSKQNRESE